MIIEFENVDHVYDDGAAAGVRALSDINLKVRDDEFIGVIGATGSGKSTLVQHMNGLLKASSGKITFDDRNIYDKDFSLRKLRDHVGLVFQYPEHQLFEMTVFDDVCFGPKNQKLDPEEVKIRATEALKMTGVGEEYYDASPFDLSGGQKRRVAIAGVLAMQPDVLILDEPAAGLDPAGKTEIFESIRTLKKNSRITVILVSHSMEDVAEYVDRLIVMDKGRIAFDDTPVNVFKNVEKLESIGLAAPEVSYVMRDLKEAGFDVSQDILTVDDAVDEILRALGSKTDPGDR